jgi:hypothetical protein
VACNLLATFDTADRAIFEETCSLVARTETNKVLAGHLQNMAISGHLPGLVVNV